MAEKKVFRASIEFKDGDGEEEGAFRSVFSTLNVIDHDDDVTLPGAFRDGQAVVVEGWNHDYGLPSGKGVIRSDETEAWIEGRFFLDTAAGSDHYRTLKNLEGLEEWSYTFNIEKSKLGEFEGQDVRFLEALDVWGVAPVTRGAGIGTRTVGLKSTVLTDEEVRQLREMLALESNTDGSEGGEGEAGDDGKPSAAPGVIATQIGIQLLEE